MVRCRKGSWRVAVSVETWRSLWVVRVGSREAMSGWVLAAAVRACAEPSGWYWEWVRIGRLRVRGG
jgi:hypothetical protein